jgi:hypothetical protein
VTFDGPLSPVYFAAKGGAVSLRFRLAGGALSPALTLNSGGEGKIQGIFLPQNVQQCTFSSNR